MKREKRIRIEVTEADVIRSVSDYLKAIGALVIRNNTGAIPQEYQDRDGFTRKRSIRFGSKGSPDLIALLANGITAFIECKRPGATLSEDQVRWHAEAARRGHLALVVHSVEELAGILSLPENRGV